MTISIRVRMWTFGKSLVLPILCAAFPTLFLYGNNVSRLMLPSLERTLLLYILLAFLVYGVSLVVSKYKFVQAANSACMFLIFFNLYGVVFSLFREKDLFRVEHFTLLPLFLVLALYAAWAISKIPAAVLWKGAVLVFGVLTLINAAKILVGETNKYLLQKDRMGSDPTEFASNPKEEYPDIYYIIFDEFAGFETMRDYWHYPEVDELVEFAEEKGFFVAEDSRSSSLSTFHQLAERMNYQEYPVVGTDLVNEYFNAIYDNRAMRFLKSIGYTTVVFEETEHFFGGFTQLEADYVFGYDSAETADWGILFDEFGQLVADNTMLFALSTYYKVMDPTLEQHRAWIHSIADNIGAMTEVPAPKFVYVHLILPHYPFMFTEDGNPVDPAYHYNWDYYLGTYKYSMKICERMIDSLLSNADPDRLPFIVIQSDHGARNILTAVSGSKIMKDFPEEYKYHIINMLYLPGMDTSRLPKDLKPINTFPLIFNFLFDARLPLY